MSAPTAADRLLAAGFDQARVDAIHAIWESPTALLPHARLLDRDRGVVPFEDWPHIHALLDLWQSERRTVILKSRQLGVSWALALYALWTANYRPGGGANVLMLSAGEREAAALLAKCKLIHAHLPDWLRLPIGKNNDSALTFPTINSQIIALPSTKDAGRGEQATLTILDEFAFHEYAAESLASLIPTVGDTGRLVAVSTANGMGGAFYDLWQQAAARGFRPHFIGWDARPDRDAAWLEARRGELGDSLEQEYPSEPQQAFLQSGRPVFPGVTLTEYPVHPTPDDLPPETIVYRPPAADRRYLIGADVAEGLAHGDRSCASVLLLDDIGRGSEAAHLCGTFEPELFALQLDALGLAYGGRLGVERNGPGVAVLQKLRSLVAERIARGDHQPYSLYHHVEPGRDPVQAGQVLPPAHLAGWRTTSASKPVLVQELGEALRTDLLQIHTPALLQELRAYAYDDIGRTSAPSGQHDDRVIALALAWQMRHAYTLIPRPAPRPIAYKRDGRDAVQDRLRRAFFGNVVAG